MDSAFFKFGLNGQLYGVMWLWHLLWICFVNRQIAEAGTCQTLASYNFQMFPSYRLEQRSSMSKQ